jgi:cell division septation protein DedD
MSLKFLNWLKLSLVILVVGGFIAMILYALFMRDSIRSAQLEPPLITAPDEPVKRRPDEAGGREFADQDKLVFDLLESPTAAQSEEILGAIPKAPLNTSETLSPTVAASVPSAASPTAALPAETVQPAIALAQAQPAAVTPSNISSPTVAAAKPEAKPATPLAAPKGWRVQLAAVPSREAGEKAAAALQKKFPVLKPYALYLEPTGKGTYMRVQFAGLKDRAAAAAVCGKLAGQACFPVAAKP